MATAAQIERLKKAKEGADRAAQSVPFPFRGLLQPLLEFMGIVLEILTGEGKKNGD